MQSEITSASHLVTVPGLDDLEADLGLADSLPVPMLADRARRAARLAADLQTALIARAVSREASPEPDRLLAVAKVAEILEFTEQYVYELIRRGHLPAVRSGKYVRVSASAVDSFIKNAMALTRRYTIGTGRLVDGPTLRRLRMRAGLTQAALAAKLGVAANSVARWERNERTIAEPMARLIRRTLELLRPNRKGA